MNNQIEIAVSILTSLLTGGFLLFFIENQHIEKDVVSQFYSIMKPFYNKLTNYLKYLSWSKNVIQYDDRKAEYISDLIPIMDELSRLAGQSIVSGNDIPVMKAKAIDKLCGKINHIWYLYDKGWFVTEHISIDKGNGYHSWETLIKESLTTYNAKYSNSAVDINLLPKVSGDFYVEEWQPVQYVTYEYESWQKKRRFSHCFLLGSIGMLMLSLIVILLFSNIIGCTIINYITIFCCCVFGYNIVELVRIKDISNKIFN
jgi:hypothetical protein